MLVLTYFIILIYINIFNKNIMTEVKKINKEATIQNILDWGNRSIGHSINVQKFKEKMDGPEWEEFLIEAAKFCKVEIVYL